MWWERSIEVWQPQNPTPSSLFAQVHEDFVQYMILVPNPTFLEQLRAPAPVDIGDLCLYTKVARKGEHAEIPSGGFMVTEWSQMFSK